MVYGPTPTWTRCLRLAEHGQRWTSSCVRVDDFKTLRAWDLSLIGSDWISDLVNAGSFAAVASYASLGLTWWEGVLANMFGGFLVAITICRAFPSPTRG